MNVICLLQNIPFPLLPFLAIIQPLKWPHFSVMYFLCAKNVAFEQEFLSFCSCNVMRSTTYLKEGRGAPYINGKNSKYRCKLFFNKSFVLQKARGSS